MDQPAALWLLLLLVMEIDTKGVTVVIVVCPLDDHALAVDVVSAAANQKPTEVVVVSSSENQEFARRIAQVDAMRVVRVEQQTPLGYARNMGAEASTTRFVAFLDSDAVPRRGWLEALCAQLGGNDVAAVGGPVLPVWPASRVPVLFRRSSSAQHFLSMFDLGRQTISVSCVLPGNMAIDRKVMESLPFDSAAGRRVGSLIGAEEIPMMIRVREAGYQVIYEPRAIVDHHTRSDRMNWVWMWRRVFAAGRESSRQSGVLEPLPRRDSITDVAFKAVVAVPYLLGKLVEIGSVRLSKGSQ